VNRVILHVDMDAFFASCELKRHPEWRGRPVIVGAGPHDRGVVSTCSYEARRFGVRSAMPSRTAYELCPEGIFTPPDIDYYKDVSDVAFRVFSRYSPWVEGVSIDEAFLDITGTIHLHGSAEKLGERLRAEIREKCGVTCSVGIAPNRLLAKIGSEMKKPDGLTMMPFDPKDIADFLAPKPIGILWGVGRKTAELLKPYGIATCRDLQRLPVDRLAGIVGYSLAGSLHDYAFGRSSDSVAREEAEEKSVSREHTFDRDETDRAAVRRKVLELVVEVGRRFRREERWAKTARLKIRDANFNTFTRQVPFATPSRDDIAFRAAAIALFNRVWPQDGKVRRVRLVGFGVANFQFRPDSSAPSLFGSPDDDGRERRERLSVAIDSLRDRGMNVLG